MTTELEHDLTALSATELAERIGAGEVSSREVVEAHLRRTETIDGRLNALFERARTAADEADARQRAGLPLGPLHGVPITVKEMFDVEGTPAAAGVKALAQRLAPADAPLVAELRRAGAIVLGKTNVPQMGMLFECDNPLYGRTNNPWNLERSSGGSSGGDAAIVAAGGVPLSLATDGGGSIRQPAHSCGVHGFKPTSWRLPLVGHLSFPNFRREWVQPGPIARRVADLDLTMRVLTRASLALVDPRVAPAPWPDYARVDLGNLRIGWYADDGFFPASAAIRRTVEEAAAALAARGATLEPFAIPEMAEACRIYFGLFVADGLAGMRRLNGRGPYDWRVRQSLRTANLPSGLRPILSWLAGAFGRRYEAQLLDMVRKRKAPIAAFWRLCEDEAAYRRRFLAAMAEKRLDALIGPPFGVPAFPHGQGFGTFPGSYCLLYNLLGMPAGVVAASRVRPDEEHGRAPSRDPVLKAAAATDRGSAGLPVGVQVAARHWRDDVALAVMAALETHFRSLANYPLRPPL
jgi:fatty acid amide hydrolase